MEDKLLKIIESNYCGCYTEECKTSFTKKSREVLLNKNLESSAQSNIFMSLIKAGPRVSIFIFYLKISALFIC